MQQHNNWGKDRDLLAEAVGKVYSEQHDPELEDLARDAMSYDQQEDPTQHVEDGEGLNPMRQFNYLMSQLSDMKKDLSLGINADSTIFQEIRHVAEQIATWCDDQQA
jgi:hypothetical protein